MRPAPWRRPGVAASRAGEGRKAAVRTTVLAVLAFGVGALMVVTTVLSAIMTLVVPRALPVLITRVVFTGVRAVFRLRGSRARSFEARDRDLALYGPISLFVLAGTDRHRLHPDVLGARGAAAAPGAGAERLLDLHPGVRGAAKPADHGAGVHRGRLRAGAAAHADQLPAL